MTTEEVEQLGKLIETKLEAEREHTRKIVREEITASEARVTKKLETLAEDMAEFFHKTWENLEATTERVKIIEDRVGIADPNNN
jgi:hypothetical protein